MALCESDVDRHMVRQDLASWLQSDRDLIVRRDRNRGANTRVSQMCAPLAAQCRNQREVLTDCPMCYIFLNIKHSVLIHAPYTRIVVFWHISNMSP